MTSYNLIKQMFYQEHEKTPVLPSLIFGALAGTIAVTFTYPSDLIKRRLQMKALNHVQKYDGIMDCTKKIWKYEGFKGFYLGLAACYIKVIPSTAIAFATNSFCKKKLGVKTGTFSS
jgi:hypothetical protein